MKYSKKHIIKVPNDITILYCTKKNIITAKGPIAQKSLKLKVKLEILEKNQSIFVTQKLLFNVSNNQKKNIKAVQGTTVALIKQMLVETSHIMYQKLKFVGVGYRSFKVEDFEESLLLLKLGYSHPIYYKIPDKLNIFCLKFTKLFIYGNSYHNITQTTAFLQNLKKPEPYKGKGILYENQKIELKEGKKV